MDIVSLPWVHVIGVAPISMEDVGVLVPTASVDDVVELAVPSGSMSVLVLGVLVAKMSALGPRLELTT
jgi:hypothetical protein